MYLIHKIQNKLFLGFCCVLLLGCGGKKRSSFNNVSSKHYSLSHGQIDKVLNKIGQLIENEAFAIDVKFDDATAKIKKHLPKLMASSALEPFCMDVNAILNEEFGISHLRIEPLLSFGNPVDKEYVHKSKSSQKQLGLAYPDLQFIQNVAVLTLPSFDTPEYAKHSIHGMLREIIHQKANTLIIDLRGNYGGQTINWLHFLSYFVSEPKHAGYPITKKQYAFVGQILHPYSGPSEFKELVTSIEAHGFNPWGKWLIKPSTLYFKGRIAVLIDQESASAAEITADALRNLRKATLIGEQTSGQALTSIEKKIEWNLSLILPIQDYITRKHQRIEGRGITPNFEVPSSSALEKTLEYLKQNAL